MGFCTSLANAPDTTCAELLGLKDKTRVASQPTLVITVWVSPKRELRANSDEEEEARDTVGELEKRTPPSTSSEYFPDDYIPGFMDFLSSKIDSPSIAAVFANYIRHQNSNMTILDGRYADRNPGCAPPITLYHPVFARFAARIRDEILPPLVVASGSATSEDTTSDSDATSSVDPDATSSADSDATSSSDAESAWDNFLNSTSEFVHSATHLVRLEEARNGIKQDLEALVNRSVVKLVNQNKTSADYTILHLVNQSAAALAIVEVKADLGLGGSDPAVQGIFSYIHYWREQPVRNVVLSHGFL